MAKSRTVSGAEYDSAYADNPAHTLTVERIAGWFAARAGGAVIARSDNVLILREADYPPVHYFPRDQVDMSALRRTDHTTWCPVKGRAAYFSVGNDPALVNAAWTYEDPFEEVSPIKDALAFYTDRVALTAETP